MAAAAAAAATPLFEGVYGGGDADVLDPNDGGGGGAFFVKELADGERPIVGGGRFLAPAPNELVVDVVFERPKDEAEVPDIIEFCLWVCIILEVDMIRLVMFISSIRCHASERLFS